MTKSLKQFEVLRWASLFLEKYDREPRVAEILLQHHLNVTRSQFYMLMQEPVSGEIAEMFKAQIVKHAETGIPVQHLTGYESFYGRDFTVNEHVLIPRPETEELVLHIIDSAGQPANSNQPLTIVDIGTGSGIIAITLALELPEAKVYASDISKDALAIARQNAKRLGADVTFLQGDFLEPIIDEQIKADIIVSNPPYIAREEAPLLSDTVKNFDPELALFAEKNGLAAYQKIIMQAPEAVNADALIAFEIGHKQGRAVRALIKGTFPGSAVTTIQDINKKDRIVSAVIEPES
ncbi:peptide chain release factor N(5)-glutamine methyltransferase [Oceanobacillus massiliensis]|uniref:peptide chain release factor N(5)-glutamine methyltransferase n=2 Tax=Oceanobacillus massiliensis TaxID=1465765 RepID=UPI0002FC60F2|nr:peptide chain release factor N(5)-glutamine methyltransferase [Oceanobacillus massiliensis]